MSNYVTQLEVENEACAITMSGRNIPIREGIVVIESSRRVMHGQ